VLRGSGLGNQKCEVVTTKGQLAANYPATAENVPQIRAAVVEFARRAGMGKERIEGLRLAVSEAVTNVVRHAYPGGTGLVGITASQASDELWVLISDSGRGHQSPSPNPGLGFGLGIIAHECDDLVLTERSDGGTEVRMRFLLKRGSKPTRRSPVAERRRPGPLRRG
jgi:serine/threonine-protein kinase RsbW